MESKLKKILSDLDFDYEKSDGLLDRIADIMEQHPEVVKPMPKSVPKALGMTPSEFMMAPLNRFQEICEAADYRKVTSSLNYILSFSGKDIPEVERRIAEIRVFLKGARAQGKGPSTSPSPEIHSTP